MALGQVKNVRWERLNDRDMILRWDKVAGATKYQIAYQKGSRGAVTNKWVATGLSFTIRNWSNNGGYRLVVKAWDNKSNSGPWSDFTNWFYTLPPTPAAPTVTLTSEGALVKWSRAGSYYTTGTQLQRDGGDTVTFGNGYDSGKSPEQYLDVTGGTGLRWRVRGFVGRASVAGERVYGSWSAWSKPVDRMVPPNAPALVSPDVFAPSWLDTVFEWKHSPRDTSAQSGAEVRFRVAGDEVWTVRAVTGSAQKLSVLLAVGSYEWQARTKGLSGEFGPWSAVSVFAVISQPSVNLHVVDETRARLVASWDYTQAEGLPQTQVLVSLLQDGNVLEQRRGNGPATSTIFSTVLKNATRYRLRLGAATGTLWSKTVWREWTTAFVPPPAPTLDARWDDMQGAHVVSFGPGVKTSATRDTVSLDLQRSTGEGWETIAEGLPPVEHTMADFEGLTWGVVSYRVVAWTDEGASATTQVDVDTRSYKLWVRWGQTAVALQYNPSHSYQAEKAESSLVYFDGEAVPTLIEGEGVKRKVTLTGTLFPEWINEPELDGLDAPSSRETLETAIVGNILVTLSTPDRLMIRGKLDASFSMETNGLTKANLTVEEAQ